MKQSTLVCVLFCIGQAVFGQSSFLQERMTTASDMRLTVNTLGMIGNAFKGSFRDTDLKYSSCEYPAGSNVEHLFEGGLWIGATLDGGAVAVSTGSVDASGGYVVGAAGFEFTAEAGAKLRERSTKLDNGAVYSPDAVSHQDFVADFTDANIIPPGTQSPIPELENGPLNAAVHFEAYNWSFAFANYFVILNYTVTNTGNQPWHDVHLGYWADPVIRNLLQTPAGAGGSSFFNKGGMGYIDSLTMAYAFDATGDVPYTDSYFGFKFLGSEFRGRFHHPRVMPGFGAHFNTWTFRDFQSVNRAPLNDAERYLKMTVGMNEQPTWPQDEKAIRRPGNRPMLLCVGPYGDVLPGESINLVFAVVCAAKYEDGAPTMMDTPLQKKILVANATWAQSAYNGEDRNFNGVLDANEDNNQDAKLTRYVLPEPPPPPRDTVILEQNSIKLYWSDNAETAVDPISKEIDFEGYRVYKTKTGFDLTKNQKVQDALELVAQYDKVEHAGLSGGYIREYDNGFKPVRLAQPVNFPGNPTAYHYLYEFKNITAGWQHIVTVTAFDRGQPQNELEPLESSPLTRLKRTFPGTPANKDFGNGDPFVYPNPYYAHAAWEGDDKSEEHRRIMFANLPPRCEVRIYTVAGDLVHHFRHEQEDGGANTQWYDTYASTGAGGTRIVARGEHAWNLLSSDSQIIARGIYLFAVKDLESGHIRQGKFVVIK